MDERAPRIASKDELVRAYKQLLQSCLDRRLSGTRQKIATALGKHKSFVSQITNPAYPAPVPARHLATIFEICHFSAEERAAFMAAYRAAHPRRGQAAGHDADDESEHVILIRVPNLGDARLQRELEETIRHTASRIVALLARH
jgi:hypothetical protein